MNYRSHHRSAQLLLWFCIITLTLIGCEKISPTTTSLKIPDLRAASEAYWPTQGWRTSPPEEQGMDSQLLAQMLEAIQKQQLSLHSLLVVRNGYLVSENYFESYRQDTRHELYSCTKSFISTLTGIAVDKGFIDRTDHRIVDFFSGRNFANLDSQKQAMTLEDLLTMRSGLDWQEGDPAYRELYQSPDWIQFMLDLPVAQPPGSRFNYCSGCSHLLSAILLQATGMNTHDFSGQYLFEPLGISNVEWQTDRAGIPIGGWGLQLTPRDMAKLGYLYLRDGQWDGQQIVSASWVQNATQKHTDTDGDLGYGYQWWIYTPLAAYTALGLYGQTIFVIPDLDLVIVTTAQVEDHDPIFRLIEQYIVPAAQKS